MKYKKYPSYKDSGVEWLGEIPSEWINTKLKYHSFIYNGNSISDNEKENYENLNTNFSIPYISTKDIDSNFLSIDYDNGMRISVNNDKFRRAKKGSSLICIEGGSAGKKLGLLEKDVCFVNKLACIDSYNNLDNKFCNYILRSSVFNYLFSLSTTGLIPGVSINQLKDFEIILPPLNEQQQIANYLDEKTSKIDTLIEKQTKQIELLKEKRQAVISHAVTKGINPNVPMKDSGVEWLGEIPEHWITPKLIYISSRIGDGLHSTPLYEDNTGFYFINGNNLINGNILFRNTSKEVSELEYVKHFIRLDSNSLLLSINGTIGNVALYNDEKIILGKSAAYINCLKKMNREFLLFYLQSNCAKRYYDIEVTGTTIFNLSLNSIRKMNIALPPYLEQHQIIRYCREMQFKYNTLIQKSNKSIELLKEKRTALISAAVTGKIDVREFE